VVEATRPARSSTGFTIHITLARMSSVVLGVIIAVVIVLALTGAFFIAKALGQKRALTGLSAADKAFVESQTAPSAGPAAGTPTDAKTDTKADAVRRPMLISDHRIVPAEDGASETHYITFSAPMGDVVDLVVPAKDAAGLNPGGKGILVYRGTRFIAFIKAPDAALPGRSVNAG